MAGDEIKLSSAPRSASVKVFNCPSCGAGVTLRAMGQSMTAVCSACGSIIDSSNENYRILEKAARQGRRAQVIPLGQRGRLHGTLWEVIGYMERTDGTHVYCWSEYLLFNPQKGFRWLTEFDGHWNYVLTTKTQPKIFTNDTRMRATYLDKHYYLFHTGKAVVSYVVGEFYWQVKQGESVEVDDFVSPPEMLSREKSSSEVIWSLGEYVNAEDIRAAFQVTGSMPIQTGVSPCQPSTVADSASSVGRYWFYLLAVLFFIQFAALFLTSGKTVHEESFVYSSTDTDRVRVSRPFQLEGRTTNLEIVVSSPVQNNWLELQTDLVNDGNGETEEFEQGIEYYSGYDSDGAWSEGMQHARTVLSSVPAGTYHLNIDASGPALPALTTIPEIGSAVAAQIVMRTELWPNGKIRSLEPVLGNVIEGVAKYYDEEGVLKQEIPYRGGRKNGKFVSYRPDGTIFEQGYYRDDQLHGTITEYGRPGQVIQEKFYEKGMRVPRLSGGDAPVTVQLRIRRDVSTWSNFFWAILLVSIFPVIILWRRRSFEISRWSQSDFSPYYEHQG